MQKNMLKRLFAAMLIAAMALGLTACGGDKDKGAGADNAGQSAQQSTALTKEEYADEFDKMGDTLTELQSKASGLEDDDVEGAKAILEDMKKPFADFAAVTPPEEYADAHVKIKAGCEAMVAYVDDIIGAAGKTGDELTKAGESMQQHLTDAMTNIAEGAQMLDEADQE